MSSGSHSGVEKTTIHWLQVEMRGDGETVRSRECHSLHVCIYIYTDLADLRVYRSLTKPFWVGPETLYKHCKVPISFHPSSPTSIPPPPAFSPSLISLMVSVDVKHHVYLVYCLWFLCLGREPRVLSCIRSLSQRRTRILSVID